jgi:hypothetical protein
MTIMAAAPACFHDNWIILREILLLLLLLLLHFFHLLVLILFLMSILTSYRLRDT